MGRRISMLMGAALVLGACAVDDERWADDTAADDTAFGDYAADDTAAPPSSPTEPPPPPASEPDGAYVNPWVDVATENTSTFGVDVDSGSYTLTRRSLNDGGLPAAGDVRVEEFINYFDYGFAGPDGALPFEVTLEAAPSLYGPADDVHLLQIGIQAEEVAPEDRLPVNLVFLLDVSGSMGAPDKLPLLQYAMKQLVDKLDQQDTLGIVVYAGASGVVLPVTEVDNKSAILDALDALQAGGSTNGAGGIRQAYQMAEAAYREGGVNRVVLVTDGDFNVGLTGQDLIDEVASWRDRGIFLTALGVGRGYGQDSFLEQLANNANGNYGYIDSQNEATRMLGDNLVSTLQVVAKDTKVQVEFDADTVERWRLIGYENRVLDNDDFDNDAVDAGDIGAGHTVVALYEVDLVDNVSDTEGLAEVRLRYKEPDSDVSSEHIWSIDASARASAFADASADLRFAAGVAEFAEVLRGSTHVDDTRLTDVKAQLEATVAEPDPSQTELFGLVGIAAGLLESPRRAGG